MKKTILTLLLGGMFAMGAQAQLLYKISGNDLEKPSYIIGTYHLADVGFIEKITGVKDALTATNQVYGELKWDDLTNTDSLKMMTSATVLPEGQTLKTVLTDVQYKKLDAYLKKMMGVGLSSPQVFQQMGHLTPATLTTQLTFLIYMQDHMGEFDPQHTFDQYFQAQAKKNSEPVGGLETVAFQVKTLFQSMTMKRQIELLMCLIDHSDQALSQANAITTAFYNQDLDALKKAMDEKLGNSCDNTPEEDATLIANRNADWAQKMPAIMKATPTFFVVGAGHLPGDKGVLQLLKTAGYTIEGVK
jgi:uncharacterized protein YbaP (TraB family)